MIGRTGKWLRRHYGRWTHGGLTCLEADAFIVGYLDGTLSETHKRKFEAHLAACPLCVAYLQDYQMAIRTTAAASDRLIDYAPLNLVDAIVRAVAPTRD